MATYLCQGCGTESAEWPGSCPTCGHTVPLQLNQPADTLTGKVVAGRYRVLKKLGQGGMGVVYLAEQLGIGQKVALKFLASHLSQDPAVARRFLNEAKSYARVAHPNAVALHEFGQDALEGALFIAMEYVEGSDLKSLLNQRKRLPLAEALDIALQVADVLAYAHEHGVIHRDLKPENIMLRKSLRGVHVKVLDFGIARLIEEGAARLTGQNGVVGTPLYMAPEQIQGREPDPRADIYALGINLFEMLAGNPPFNGPDFNVILQHQINTPLPALPLSDFEDLSAVDPILQRICAKDPAQRYSSMAEVAQALGTLSPVTQRSFSLPPESMGNNGTLVLKPHTPLPDRMVKTAQPDGVKPGPRSSPLPKVAGVLLFVAALIGVGYWVKVGTAGAIAHDPEPVHDAGQIVKRPEVTDSDADRKRLQFLADEMYRKAEAEFVSGNFIGARRILESVPQDETVALKVRELAAQIDDASQRMIKAQGLAARGDCGAAIQVYDGILRDHPALAQARRERERCAHMMLPSVTE